MGFKEPFDGARPTRPGTYAGDEVNDDFRDLVRSQPVVHLSVVADLIGCVEVQVVERVQRREHLFESGLHCLFVLLQWMLLKTGIV